MSKNPDLSLYGSHVPVLVKVIEKTDGAMLDLGMGLSTVLMHMMAKKTKRIIASIETDAIWYKAHQMYVTPYHWNWLVPEGEWWKKHILHNIKYGMWSFALIDSKPMKDRRKIAMYLKDYVDYILLHDSEPEQNKFTGYNGIYRHFKYVYQYTDCKPHTAIVSNFKDPKLLWQK